VIRPADQCRTRVKSIAGTTDEGSPCTATPRAHNKDQVRGFYQGKFSAFDTPKPEFHEVLWDGDVASIRFTMTGRHVDEFMGVPASGTAIALPGITILHFRGDRVVERFSQADMLGLLIKVGAVPAPA
jgi:predicted ester cyclase